MRRLQGVDSVRILLVHAAIGAAGADVRRYYLWTFLDTFVWSLVFAKRFGLVRVASDILARIPTASAAWYGDVVAANSTDFG